MTAATRPIVYHIPVCPFSQRLEVLLALKGQRDAVEFRKVDITRPRDPELLRKANGTTALPMMELPDGRILKESLVLLDYLDETLPGGLIRRADPYDRAVERMLIAKEGSFATQGYVYVMNADPARRAAHRAKMDALWRDLDTLLRQHNPGGDFLFERFGLAEAVFTPLFMRFWFLGYYEGYDLPADASRARRWREACLAHPVAQQVTEEEIVKVYYDYALGAGNGALVPGRRCSSFVFSPDWRDRPWPPRDKYGARASDAELGLA